MQNFSLRLKYSENSGDSYTIWVHILGGTLGHFGELFGFPGYFLCTEEAYRV